MVGWDERKRRPSSPALRLSPCASAWIIDRRVPSGSAGNVRWRLDRCIAKWLYDMPSTCKRSHERALGTACERTGWASPRPPAATNPGSLDAMARAATLRRTTRASRPRRLSGTERRATIVAAAAQLFAAQGFAPSTRDLAAVLGLSQALLYRYFRSKAALVGATLASTLVDRWQAEWSAWLADA